MTDTPEPKTKIAILGGGMAGLTAAFELSRTPELREKYEVTVHQMGWRLGGKCATGRGVFGRIEEHGIHAFVGSYYNALGLMADCYEALKTEVTDDTIRQGCLGSFGEAFKTSDYVVLWECLNQRMVPWGFKLENNVLPMGSAENVQQSVQKVDVIIRETSKFFHMYYNDRVKKGGDAPVRSKRIAKHYRDNNRLGQILLNTVRAIGAAIRAFLDTAGRTVAAAPYVLSLLLWIFRRRKEVAQYLALFKGTGIIPSFGKTFLNWWMPNTGWDVPKGKPFITVGDKLRRLGIIFNYIFSLWRAIFTSKYNIFEHGAEILDDRNFMEWLTEHGLDERSEYAPIVINNVDISYNFPDGDNSQKPQMAAGSYLRWSLRMILNLQAFVWSFEAGTGETVIAPLYHVLKQRGVKFAFFHKVAALRISDDQRSIRAIEIDRQADIVDWASEYEPLQKYPYETDEKERRYLLGWPAEPQYHLLKQANDIKAQGIDLESYWAKWPASADGAAPDVTPGWKTTLNAGVDYDQIVFAISVGAVPALLLPDIDIMREPPTTDPTEPPQAARWRAMVKNVPACATQQLQIWLDLSTKSAGGQTLLDQSVNKSYSIMSGTFIAPFNGQADFSHLLRYEGWGGPRGEEQVHNKPHAVWYFSGALALRYPTPGAPPPPLAAAHTSAAGFDVQDFPARQKARVWDAGVQFLQATGAYLLPNLAAGWEPMGLDFSRLKGIDRHLEIAPPESVEPNNSGAQHVSDKQREDARIGKDQADLVLHFNQVVKAKGAETLYNQYWRANIEPSERYVQCPPGGTSHRLKTHDSGFDNMVLAGDWIRNGLNVGSVEGAVMGGKLAAHAVRRSVSVDDVIGFRRELWTPAWAKAQGRAEAETVA